MQSKLEKINLYKKKESDCFFYIIKNQKELLEIAEKRFSENYKKEIKKQSLHYSKSLVSRYLISDFLEQNFGKWEEIEYWNYRINEKLRFSCSFCGDYIVIGFAEKKIGLDAEIIKIRSQSLLKDRNQGKTYKSRDEFYISRTQKEAIAKCLDLGLNDVLDINPDEHHSETHIVKSDNFSESIVISISLKKR